MVLGLLLHEGYTASYLLEVITHTQTGEQRWIFLCVTLAFAGLPPFIFFFAKLSLLGLLAARGLWYAFLLALLLIGVG